MKTLSQRQMTDKIESNDNALLINVLSREQFQKEHIPGSINIPLDQDDFVKSVKNRVSGKDQEIIVYCASTDCPASGKAAEKLENAGFTNVYDYDAGLKDWKESGNEVQGSAARG